MPRYDVHYEPLRPDEIAAGSGKLFTFRYKATVAVRGPQKLINRWLKCLMTTKGTDFLHPNYGTGFSGLIGANVQNYGEVADLVAIYIDDCNAQMRDMDRVNQPDTSERFQSAAFTSITPAGAGADGFNAIVTLQNAAGLVAQLPLPTIAAQRGTG